MRDTDGRRVSWEHEHAGRCVGGIRDGDSRIRPANNARLADSLPDLSDPATGGILLAMLDAATGHDMHAVPLYAGGWQVSVTDGPAAGEHAGPSLGEACARALIAIGRVAP